MFGLLLFKQVQGLQRSIVIIVRGVVTALALIVLAALTLVIVLLLLLLLLTGLQRPLSSRFDFAHFFDIFVHVKQFGHEGIFVVFLFVSIRLAGLGQIFGGRINFGLVGKEIENVNGIVVRFFGTTTPGHFLGVKGRTQVDFKDFLEKGFVIFLVGAGNAARFVMMMMYERGGGVFHFVNGRGFFVRLQEEYGGLIFFFFLGIAAGIATATEMTVIAMINAIVVVVVGMFGGILRIVGIAKGLL
mmetsp:Transcript_20591/g.44561  ORF Transcript_20591/g.44561 Transcript_20591/m.44561 type:complete len:244 (-) Transcript_20591:719-1450(-)